MKYIQWSDELSVNVEEIDSQHKEFIALINELHGAMKIGRDEDMLAGILARLIEYAVIHLVTEERLLKTHGYPDLVSHKKEHDEFKKHIQELRRKFVADQTVPAVKVAEFLRDWLTNHIKLTDMKYRSFLNRKGVF